MSKKMAIQQEAERLTRAGEVVTTRKLATIVGSSVRYTGLILAEIREEWWTQLSRAGDKTHCAKGHEFTPENTEHRDGQRRCRICHRDQERNRQRRNRERRIRVQVIDVDIEIGGVEASETRMDERRTIENVTCVHASELAIKVESKVYSGWVPQEAVHDDSEVYRKGHVGRLVIKGWFAEKKKLELD